MGKFIAIEGLDGAGTTTQAKLLVDWLSERGEAHLTREPTDRSVGRIIRRVLSGDPEAPHWHTLPWLFAADRADHLTGVVEPALERGVYVVTDRYYHSSLAYQSLTMPLEEVAALNRFRAPDLTCFVHVPVDVCLERIQARGEPREIFEQRERLETIAAAYDRVMRFLADRGEPIVTVDGTAPIDEVFGAIRDHVRSLRS